MKALIAPLYSSTPFSILFSHYIKTSLNANSSYDGYAAEAVRFIHLENLPLDTLKEINPFLDNEIFSFPARWLKKKRFDLLIGFENFCKTVVMLANGHEPEFIDMKGLQCSPIPGWALV